MFALVDDEEKEQRLLCLLLDLIVLLILQLYVYACEVVWRVMGVVCLEETATRRCIIF